MTRELREFREHITSAAKTVESWPEWKKHLFDCRETFDDADRDGWKQFMDDNKPDPVSKPPEKKETNPKDAVGIAKAPMSCVPAPVLLELGLAMAEGARKYGRHNYRVTGVRASVYYDAALRHLFAYWEGQDVDPDSGLSHLVKAMACLTVLRDADMRGMLEDDRPPKTGDSWVQTANDRMKELLKKYPECKPAHTEKGKP